MKILVIDDEPLVRRSLKRVLSISGDDVEEAIDGEDGLKKWVEGEPEIVFLDILMPGLSGPQVLKKMEGEKKCPVILMSAYSADHNIETARRLGADLFIQKPFEDIFEIAKIVEKFKKTGSI